MKKLLLILLCFTTVLAFGQSRKRTFRQREIGFLAGGSYYIGDINQRAHFNQSHPSFGAFFRYTTNYRYAFRFGFNMGTISGDDASSPEADQRERNLNFRSKIYEFHTIAEFNFVEYRISHARHNFTMFVFAGLAGFQFDPQASVGGSYQPLRGMNTEGQSRRYPRTQLSVPFGVGLKFNLGERCGVSLEWGPRRTFTDYLDDIKGTYPNFVGEASTNGLTDRSGSARPGDMRGNPSTRDWYFFYGISLNIKLKDPRSTCHGAGRR